MATSGLVIGKFLPFHDGHAHLMETASRAVDELVVIVCSAAWHEIPVELRVEWIAESFPDARVVVIDQEQRGLGEGGTEAWAAATLDVLGRRPDVVYTSEDYGPAYAGLMGAEHVMVDRERAVVPVSGTEVRERPLAHLDLLSPQVRAHYVLRVCVIGAESTGKTTLARDPGRPLRRGVRARVRPLLLRGDAGPDPVPLDHRGLQDDRPRPEPLRGRRRALGGTGARLRHQRVRHQRVPRGISGSPRPVSRGGGRRPALRPVPAVRGGDAVRAGRHRPATRGDATGAHAGRYLRHLEEGGHRFARVEGTRSQRLSTAVAAVDPLLAAAGAEPLAGRAISLR
jgi:cytidyltransferase-like protein